MSTLLDVSNYLQIPTNPENLLQAQRLFHGRGHAYEGLHHLTIDWLPPVLLITLYSPEPQPDIDILSNELISKLPDCKSIQLQRRYELLSSIEVIRGDAISHLPIQENDLLFNIHLGQTQNTGLFLDMKNGRSWVQQHSKNKRVLNLFAYTCGFSVAAVAGGAKSVLNVDMSSSALNQGRENHRLNQHALEKVRFEKLNIFKSFSRLKKRGAFDLLICDPPTFQKGSVDISKDYPKIIRRLDEFMAPGSLLLLCLNAPLLNRKFLLQAMQELAPDYKLIEEIKAPEVFVEKQDKGLKIFSFQNIPATTTQTISY